MIYVYYLLIFLNIYFGMFVLANIGRHMFVENAGVSLSGLVLAFMSLLLTALIYVHSMVS